MKKPPRPRKLESGPPSVRIPLPKKKERRHKDERKYDRRKDKERLRRESDAETRRRGVRNRSQ